jgi:hypothetical protein
MYKYIFNKNTTIKIPLLDYNNNNPIIIIIIIIIIKTIINK